MSDEIERDLRIYAGVACPYCGARIGERCTLDSGAPRGMPHAERLAAWRAAQAPVTRGRDNRDAKIVAAVACPMCEVAIGVWCVRHPGSTIEIPGTHPERREAWQAVRGVVVAPIAADGPPPPDHINSRQERKLGIKCACARCTARQASR